MRILHKGLTAAKDLLSLQTYVMLIVGVKQFLRNDEEGRMIHKLFAQDMLIVSLSVVKALNMNIQGKTNKDVQHLWMWADDQCPEFCPIRRLLVHLDLIGYKGAIYFPHTMSCCSHLQMGSIRR